MYNQDMADALLTPLSAVLGNPGKRKFPYMSLISWVMNGNM